MQQGTAAVPDTGTTNIESTSYDELGGFVYLNIKFYIDS